MASSHDQPVTAVQVQSISELCESLGYRISAPRSQTPLTRATHAWRQQYKAPDGTPGKLLVDWQSPRTQHLLSALTTAFLEADDNGHRLWPGSDHTGLSVVLDYSKDWNQIFLLLKQLFWRQNMNERRRNDRSPINTSEFREEASNDDTSASANRMINSSSANCLNPIPSKDQPRIAPRPTYPSSGLATPNNAFPRTPFESQSHENSISSSEAADRQRSSVDGYAHTQTLSRPSGITMDLVDLTFIENDLHEEQSRKLMVPNNRKVEQRGKNTLILTLKLSPQKLFQLQYRAPVAKMTDTVTPRSSEHSARLAVLGKPSSHDNPPLSVLSRSDDGGDGGHSLIRKSERRKAIPARSRLDVPSSEAVQQMRKPSRQQTRISVSSSEGTADAAQQSRLSEPISNTPPCSASGSKKAKSTFDANRKPKRKRGRPKKEDSSSKIARLEDRAPKAPPDLVISQSSEASEGASRAGHLPLHDIGSNSTALASRADTPRTVDERRDSKPSESETLADKHVNAKPTSPPMNTEMSTRPALQTNHNTFSHSTPKTQIKIVYCLITSRTPRLAIQHLRDFAFVGKSLNALFVEISGLTSRTDIIMIHLKLQTSQTEVQFSLSVEDTESYEEMKKTFSEEIKEDVRLSGNTQFKIWLEPNPPAQVDVQHRDAVEEIEFSL